jgi:hypothetical protein
MDVGISPVLATVAALLAVMGVVGVVLSLVLDRGRPLPARALQPVEMAPAEPVDTRTLAARGVAYRRGIYILIGLAVLTALEFLIAIALEGSVVFLFLAALIKAGLIIQYYMHLGQVWGEEEAHS